MPVALAGLLALCGCSTPTPNPSSSGGTPVANASSVRCRQDTGTLLHSCAEERLMHRVGSQDAQDDATQIRSLANITGARGN